MRHPSCSGFLGLAIAGLASFAVASPSAAAPTAFQNAQLTIQIGLGYSGSPIPLIAIPPGPTLASGTADAVFTTGGGLFSATLPASVFDGAGIEVPVTDPLASPIRGLQPILANGNAAFTAMGGGFGGTMPLLGIVRLCLFDPCNVAVGNISVPLSVAGQGGTASATFLVNLTVQGAPWATGPIAVTTPQGAVLTASGGVTATPGGGAHVRLVTPVFVSTNIGASALVPVIGMLRFDLVPEPASLLLLGSGVVGLASAGWRRKR